MTQDMINMIKREEIYNLLYIIISEVMIIMLEKNSMISFNTPDEFLKFYYNLNLPNEWIIESGYMNDRGNKIYNTSYVAYLKSLFNQKRLFRRSVSIAEIVSWIDGYTLISRLLKRLSLEISREIYDNIIIYLEYKIDMSKNRRIDCIFRYKKRVLITEFRLSSKFPNLTNAWQKKEIELIIYKELMYNYFPDDIKIIIYAMILMPEYNNGKRLEKNIKYNDDNINHFKEYIIKYLLEGRHK